MRDNRSLMQQMADSVDDARQLKRQAKDCNDCEALIRADVEKGLREQGWKSPEQWADFRTKVANGEITVNDLLKAQDRAARQDERRKCQQETIDSLNDYGEGKISLERLAERLGGMNVYELIDAFRSYQSGDSPEPDKDTLPNNLHTHRLKLGDSAEGK